MKIIHIVENLDKGAVENWLVRTFILCTELRKDWSWTFYCILGVPGKLDDEVRKRGGHIVYAPVTISQKWSFLKHLRHTLKEGKFDLIHSHHDFLSGFYLLASHGIKFRKRILHIHNNDRALPVGSPIMNQLIRLPLKWLAYWYNDLIVGISRYTLEDFTSGINLGLKPATKVLYYGVDLTPYTSKKTSIREQLKLSPDTKLMLFVGRMNPYKNPLFAIDVFSELRKIKKNIHFLLIGKGELETEINQHIDSLGIRDHIGLLGWRDDIAGIMLDSDVFIFPRVEEPKEGLGLVVIEAQAAGLQLFITNGIVEDAIVVKPLTTYLSLHSGSKQWAEYIAAKLDSPVSVSRQEALHTVMASPFELHRATDHFISLYEA